MLLMVESKCPECNKKIFLILKMGGDTIMVTHVKEKDYRNIIDIHKMTELVWENITKKALMVKE